VSLIVQGLLTYQIFSVETLVHQLGDRELKRAIEDVTEAELSRVFAAIHLEQISSAVVTQGEQALVCSVHKIISIFPFNVTSQCVCFCACLARRV
jgi:hypothetical protein